MDSLEVFGLSGGRRNADFLLPKKSVYCAGFSNIRVSNETNAVFCGSLSKRIIEVCLTSSSEDVLEKRQKTDQTEEEPS